jgi:hypothetical protein
MFLTKTKTKREKKSLVTETSTDPYPRHHWYFNKNHANLQLITQALVSFKKSKEEEGAYIF